MESSNKLFSEADFYKEKQLFTSKDFEKDASGIPISIVQKNESKDKLNNHFISRHWKVSIISMTTAAAVCLLGYCVFAILSEDKGDNSAAIEQVAEETAVTTTVNSSQATTAGIQKEEGSVTTTAIRTEFSAETERQAITVFPVELSGTLEQKAKDVIRGKYGNGEVRKQKLGEQYAEIQNKVNEMYRKGLIK